MSGMLGSEFRLLPAADRGWPQTATDSAADDFTARTVSELFAAVQYAAVRFAKQDLARTYGRPADPAEQDAYERERRQYWMRRLIAGTPDPTERGDHGLRWTSDPAGTWEVNVTSEGCDVWTDPIHPLTPSDRRDLADALLAVDVHGGELDG